MSEKLAELQTKHQKEQHQLQVDDYSEKKKQEAYIFLGEIRAVGKIANALKSQEIKAIEAIQNNKLYLDLGFETFASFLASDLVPISKNRFYDATKLLEAEGEQLFDLLNEVGVAKSVRKLLASGDYEAIQIEDNKILVGNQEADLGSVQTVKKIIDAYVNQCVTLETKLQKGEEDNKRRKEQIKDLEDKLNQNQFSSSLSFLDKSHTSALGSLTALANELKNATIIDCNDYLEKNLKLLASQYNQINQILSEKLGVSSLQEFTVEDEADAIAAILDDED
jgi:hypothetical protein